MPKPTPSTTGRTAQLLKANNVDHNPLLVDGDDVVDVAPATAAPAPAPPKLRRRPVAIAVGVLIVVLGSLVTAFIVASVQDTVQVVAVRADIPRGDVIQAADLTIVGLRPDPQLRTIPADQLASLIGKRAAMDLHSGGLVSPASVANQVIPAAGESIVGIPIEPGQMPAWQLKAGDKVRIMSTPRAQDDPSTKPPKVSLEARVVAVHGSADQTLTVVDVSVPADQAETLGALAATRRVALVLDNS